MILNEPSDLRLGNTQVQEHAIKGGQYCIYARAVIHTHNVMAGAGRYANCRHFLRLFLFVGSRPAPLIRLSKSKINPWCAVG